MLEKTRHRLVVLYWVLLFTAISGPAYVPLVYDLISPSAGAVAFTAQVLALIAAIIIAMAVKWRVL